SASASRSPSMTRGSLPSLHGTPAKARAVSDRMASWSVYNSGRIRTDKRPGSLNASSSDLDHRRIRLGLACTIGYPLLGSRRHERSAQRLSTSQKGAHRVETEELAQAPRKAAGAVFLSAVLAGLGQLGPANAEPVPPPESTA